MSFKSDLGKLRTASPGLRILIIESIAWLAIARIAVTVLPMWLVFRMNGFSPVPVPGDLSVASSSDIVGTAIRIASSRAPWSSTCLVQALAAAKLLRNRHRGSTLVLGTTWTGPLEGRLSAHAWLLSAEGVVTGGQVKDQYRPVAAFAVGPQW